MQTKIIATIALASFTGVMAAVLFGIVIASLVLPVWIDASIDYAANKVISGSMLECSEMLLPNATIIKINDVAYGCIIKKYSKAITPDLNI